jgi:hypothetical protein
MMVTRRIAGETSVLGHEIVWIAVHPSFPWFGGSHDGMRGTPRVLGRVPVWRRIAAERDAACLARAEMYPARFDLHALFAFVPLWLPDGRDGFDIRANAFFHTFLQFDHVTPRV